MILEAVLEYVSEQVKMKFQVALRNRNVDMALSQVEYAFKQVLSAEHTPVSMTGMPESVVASLEANDIFTIEELVCYTPSELLVMRDIGPYVVGKIAAGLNKYKLALRPD